ncbi:hypothetical protein HYU17_02485 [Candidatus Woesearchaeota archaeon]|nr:hypothetical protein [Candidatus Woesearchaeota archaeon]
MPLIIIILFFAYTWGLGFTLLRLARAKEHESFLERNLMRTGIGLSAFVVLGVILNALRIPLDYRIFLLAASALPLYELIFRKGYARISPAAKAGLKLRQSDITILLVLLVFAAALFTYASGAFRYDYLEDDDPWGHASAIKYVSVEKTVFDPETVDFHYMDPYPPGYDMLLGVLAQASQPISWTIKFFNALLISLSIIFFYFFAKEFLGSRNKALFAAFVLASVPAYMSHFIWAPVLAMAVFPQAMYAFEMMKHDRKWIAIAGVCFAAILLAHPTHAVKLTGLVLIYLGVKAAAGFTFGRKHLPEWLHQDLAGFGAVALGAFLSLFWWAAKLKGFLGMAKTSFTGGSGEAAAELIKGSGNILSKLIALPARIFNPEGGTATRAYLLRDFAIAQSNNMINNPIGIGLAAFILMIAGFASTATGILRSLPRRRMLIPAAAAAAVILTVLISSATFSYQQELYDTNREMLSSGEMPGWRFAQLWPTPPSYPSVLALSSILSSLTVAFALSIAAITIFRRKEQDGQDHRITAAILLGWLLFTFLGINSRTFNLPVGLFAFRFWMIFAIPAALLAAEGLFAALNAVKALRLGPAAATTAKLAIIALVVAGVLFTSAKQKYDTNTSCWPSGAFWSGELVLEPSSNCPVQSELLSYQWLKTLPATTKVFTFYGQDQVIGFDRQICSWCKPEHSMKKRLGNATATELHTFMKDNNYEYAILGGIEARSLSLNETVRLINDMASSGLFTIAHNGQSAVVFKAE